MQGIPHIQWGQGLTRSTNTLQVPSMANKHGLIEWSKRGGGLDLANFWVQGWELNFQTLE